VVAGVGYGDFNWAVLATFLLAAWVLLAGVRDIFDKTRHKGLIKGLPTLTRSYWGMQMAHLGIAVCALGVVLPSRTVPSATCAWRRASRWTWPVITSSSKAPSTSKARTSLRQGHHPGDPRRSKSACCTRKNACTPCRTR
jgi:cytochrome c-type biogenesis protein CcmF